MDDINGKSVTASQISKYQKHRKSKREQGMREVRIWTMDPHNPEVRARLIRDMALLKGKPEELEALDFIEAAMDWPDDDIPEISDVAKTKLQK